MTARQLRRALGWVIITSSGLAIITAPSPSVGLVGFICLAIGCALLVDD